MTRRSPWEIVIKPDVRPHVKRRTAVTVVFAPTEAEAAELLLELVDN